MVIWLGDACYLAAVAEVGPLACHGPQDTIDPGERLDGMGIENLGAERVVDIPGEIEAERIEADRPLAERGEYVACKGRIIAGLRHKQRIVGAPILLQDSL